MTTASPQPAAPRSRRRLAIVLAVGILLTVVVAGLVLAWFIFFGSEAPPAPSLDDAVRQLLPSIPPQ